MTRIRIFITLSVLIYFFTECSGDRTSEPEVHSEARLQDSIIKLDSLSSILLFKDNSLALKYVNTAIEISRKIRSAELLARSMNVKGIVFSANRYDSAFACFTEALSLSGGPGTESEKAHMLYNLSQLYYLVNDYKNTVTLLDSSIQIGLKYKNHRAVTSSLIALGNVYFVIEDYTDAKNIYDSALRMSSRYSLNKEMAVVLANLAKFGEDATASKSMLRQAISLLNKTKGTEEELVTTEINLGLLQENPDSAILYYQSAIDKATKYNMQIELLGAYNNIAYTFLEKKNIVKAYKYIAVEAIPLALKLKNDDWLSTLYDTYADILIAKKDFQEAIIYLRKSVEARSASDKQISDKQIRLLNAILGLKNKDLLIAEKEGLIIQKDARIDQMHLWLAMSGIIVLIAGTGVFWIRQRAKIKLQQTKLEAAQKIIEAEENEKERNAMELHDAVGSLVFKLSETVNRSMVQDPSAKQAIDLHMGEFKDEIRNLSHRMSRDLLQRYPIDALLRSFFNDTIHYSKLNLKYNVDKPITAVKTDAAIHLFRIVQELINNARKHAGNAEIKIAIHFFQESFELTYSDNGTGFSPDSGQKKGMGFSNILARVNLINGTAELDSEPGHGVYWKITAPTGTN